MYARGGQSLWILLAPCVRSAEKLSGAIVTVAKPFSHRGRAVATEQEFGERYEGEGTFAASTFELCLLARFLQFVVDMVCLWTR